MTIKQALSQARAMLVTNDIEDASLECQLLLMHTLGISRVQLYIDLEHELSPEQEEGFWDLVKRRISHEPVAYITGHREFYGFDFYVDSDVFIPRPESELLVEKALELAQEHTVSTIAEVGTGCGAIAISLALNMPQPRIYATDISASALKIALFNCEKHGVTDRIRLLQGDMLDPLPESTDLIIANLPYVEGSALCRVCPESFEPRLALNGGPDGLGKVHQLCSQVGGKLHPKGCLLLEIGQGQSEIVANLLRSLFPSSRVEITPDLSGIDRVISLGLTISGAFGPDFPQQVTANF